MRYSSRQILPGRQVPTVSLQRQTMKYVYSSASTHLLWCCAYKHRKRGYVLTCLHSLEQATFVSIAIALFAAMSDSTHLLWCYACKHSRRSCVLTRTVHFPHHNIQTYANSNCAVLLPCRQCRGCSYKGVCGGTHRRHQPTGSR